MRKTKNVGIKAAFFTGVMSLPILVLCNFYVVNKKIEETVLVNSNFMNIMITLTFIGTMVYGLVAGKETLKDKKEIGLLAISAIFNAYTMGVVAFTVMNLFTSTTTEKIISIVLLFINFGIGMILMKKATLLEDEEENAMEQAKI